MLFVMVDDVAADVTEGNGPIVSPQDLNQAEYGLFQVNIPGAATVSLKGRTSPNMPWFEITNLTATGAQRVSLASQMTVAISGHSGGAVRAELLET